MSEEDSSGDKINIRAGKLNVSNGGTVGVDRSTSKAVNVQQNNQLNVFFAPQTDDHWKHARQLIALVAGLILIATVLAITVRTEKMSAPLYTFLRIVLALGGAAFAVCIDGFLRVRFKTWLKATAGFAIFVLIFFFQVARPTAATPESDEAGSTPPAVRAPGVPAAK